MTHTAPEPQSPSPRPLWIPPDVKIDSLPAALQRAITEIINPAYRELVLEAQSAIERAAGLRALGRNDGNGLFSAVSRHFFRPL
jgi:hypothetical protein